MGRGGEGAVEGARSNRAAVLSPPSAPEGAEGPRGALAGRGFKLGRANTHTVRTYTHTKGLNPICTHIRAPRQT